VLAILIVFIAVSAVEVVAVDVIVRRWANIRIPLLILSLWGLIYMLGFLFGMLTRPHAIVQPASELAMAPRSTSRFSGTRSNP
jgi:hypothetical protein